MHCSMRDALEESARLYFAGQSPDVLRIDPRRLDVRLEFESTPRGPMPHVFGGIPLDAIRATHSLAEIATLPDRVTGTRFAVVGYRGMTLLDLVGVCDPLSRVRSQGIDPESTLRVIAFGESLVFSEWGSSLSVDGSPNEDAAGGSIAADVLITVGGFDIQAMAESAPARALLARYPSNRLIASVCTGALFLGAAGRLAGKRATTHASARAALSQYGASVQDARVVTDGNVVTGGGVTCGIDVGLALVERIYGEKARATIAERMQWPL